MGGSQTIVKNIKIPVEIQLISKEEIAAQMPVRQILIHEQTSTPSDDFIQNNIINASYSELFIVHDQNNYSNLKIVQAPPNANEDLLIEKLNFLNALNDQNYKHNDLSTVTDFQKQARYINTVQFYCNLKKQITSLDPIHLHQVMHRHPHNTKLIQITMQCLNQDELNFLATQDFHAGYKTNAQTILKQNIKETSISENILPMIAYSTIFVTALNLLSRKLQPPKKSPKIKIAKQQTTTAAEEETTINQTNQIKCSQN